MQTLSSLGTEPNSTALASDFDSEHPIIQMPFSAIVDGRLFEGDGISLVGARAQGLVSQQLEGEHRLVTLVFPFAGFNVTLPVEASLHTSSSASGKLALRFTNPTGPHYTQLRHLLNSYISGDIADVGSVLSTSAGDPRGAEKIKPTNSRTAGRLLAGLIKGLLITAASVALFGFVGSKVYERAFVSHAEGISLISKSNTALRAVSSGQLDFVNPNAAQGQVAYAVRTTSGDLVSISMPCACVALPGALTAGATVLAGDAVMRVATPNAATQIDARVPLQAYRALVGGATARVELGDGSVILATLQQGTVTIPQDSAQDVVQVVLLPESEVDPSLIGTPVSITVGTVNANPTVALIRDLVSQGANR
jgi:alginate biosynthesis protein Alg44